MRASRHAALVPPDNDRTGATPAGGERRPNAFAREVTVVLAVKIAALLVLWLAFFRTADAPQPALDADRVARHLLVPPGSAHVGP